MGWLLLEAGVALGLLIFIVWFTLPRPKPNQKPHKDPHENKDD
jgi:hypothetical protein